MFNSLNASIAFDNYFSNSNIQRIFRFIYSSIYLVHVQFMATKDTYVFFISLYNFLLTIEN